MAEALDPASPSSPEGPAGDAGPPEDAGSPEGGRSPAEDRDAADVCAARNGSSTAFDRLVVRHQQAVIDAAQYFLGNYQDALEVAQEAFIKAFRALENFRGDSRFRTWILRITTNCARSFHTKRTAKRRSAPTVPIHGGSNAGATDDPDKGGGVDVADYGDTPDGQLERREVKEALEAAILDLEPEVRELVVLRDITGESYESIATQFDLPLGTVKSKVHRARLVLREKMKRFL